MVICSFGRAGLAARIREHIRLARLFASWLDADPQFQLLAPVTMAVVCFRVVPHVLGSTPALDQELNSLNRRLVEAVNRTGKAYLTHTTLNGQIAMRLTVGNILTTERHLAMAFDLIRREVARLGAAP
jgi:aromatic-L-amino-acid decarboxylase